MKTDQKEDNQSYKKDTIGYHYRIAKVIYGKESAATKWLVAKAKESPDGFHEKVVMHETQVIYLLNQFHKKGPPTE